MLKGHVFNLQTFTSDAFAIFVDKFLVNRSGILRGCELSNTTNSVTISEGYFVIRGRILEIISSETIDSIINTGYYSLVCEIDLSKSNTSEQLNQAEIKLVYNSTTYPTLTQQDITADGTIYQYEFARFKVEGSGITDFTDRRNSVDFISQLDMFYPIGSIYISASSTNPNVLFGGVWEQIKDKFLLSAGDTYSAGSTGGEATHKLTVEEMPSHSHRGYIDGGSGMSLTLQGSMMTKQSTPATYTDNTGGNKAHNNMPPYLSVYVWKRIS